MRKLKKERIRIEKLKTEAPKQSSVITEKIRANGENAAKQSILGFFKRKILIPDASKRTKTRSSEK